MFFFVVLVHRCSRDFERYVVPRPMLVQQTKLNIWTAVPLNMERIGRSIVESSLTSSSRVSIECIIVNPQNRVIEKLLNLWLSITCAGQSTTIDTSSLGRHYSSGIGSTSLRSASQLLTTFREKSLSWAENVWTARVVMVFSRLCKTTRSSCHILRGRYVGVGTHDETTHEYRINTLRAISFEISNWSRSMERVIFSASSAQPSF